MSDSTPLEIRDVDEARVFYRDVLGSVEHAHGDQRLEFNLHGHRIICRLNPKLGKHGRVASHYDLAEDKYALVAHCSVVMEMSDWRALVKRLKQQEISFIIEPYRRLKNATGVRAMLVLLDPSGNALEVQSFCNSGEEFLRCERQMALARWRRWAVLTAFIVCCILLLVKKWGDSATDQFAEAALLPVCVITGSCGP